MRNVVFIAVLSLFGVIAPCAAQSYQTTEKDIGVDIVSVKAIKSNLRDSPGTLGKVITTFPKLTRLLLVSRNDVGGWYEVANIYTQEKGWMHASTIDIYLTNRKADCPASAASPYSPPVRTSDCTRPLYIDEEDDKGYDFAVMKGLYMVMLGGQAKAASAGKRFILLSRELEGSTLKILDTATGEIGTTTCPWVQIYYTRKQRESAIPFVKTCSGYSTAPPTTTIQNDANRTLFLYIDGVKFIIPTQESRSIDISAGTHNYMATAANVLPLSGTEVWQSGCSYKWSFWIETR